MEGLEHWVWRIGISPILVFSFSLSRTDTATYAMLGVGVFKCHVSFGMSLED